MEGLQKQLNTASTFSTALHTLNTQIGESSSPELFSIDIEKAQEEGVQLHNIVLRL